MENIHVKSAGASVILSYNDIGDPQNSFSVWLDSSRYKKGIERFLERKNTIIKGELNSKIKLFYKKNIPYFTFCDKNKEVSISDNNLTKYLMNFE